MRQLRLEEHLRLSRVRRMLGMFTLIATGFLILIINPAIPDGAFKLGSSGEPILDGFRAIYGTGAAKLLALAAVAGLVASFHAIIFAFGRQIYSLSRAGYFPHFLSVTHGDHKTPNVALIAGSLLGLGVMLVVWFAQGGVEAGSFIGGVLLNMAVFGAMISYLLQGLSFIRLRQRFPNIERPYRSPLGVPGAAATVVIALITIYFQLTDPVYQTGVIGVAIWYALGGHCNLNFPLVLIRYNGVFGGAVMLLSRMRSHARLLLQHDVVRDGQVTRTCCGESGEDWQWDHGWRQIAEAALMI